MRTPSTEHHEHEYKYDLLCRLLEEGRSCSPPPAATAAPPQSPSSSPSPPPSAEQHEYEYKYDLLCHLLKKGRSWSPTPAATATPPQSPSSSPSPSTLLHGGAPCTTSKPRKRTPAWAGAIRGFSNTLCLVILVFLVAPMAMRSTNKEDVLGWVSISVLSFAFPVMGYVFTWDQP